MLYEKGMGSDIICQNMIIFLIRKSVHISHDDHLNVTGRDLDGGTRSD
jgi:hypothetical protein